MKVFISWSGARSKAVAEVLGPWLKCVLQASEPWISTSNLDNGTAWFNEISRTLSEVKVGIFCITPENREKPWILFEAGAISSKLNESRVINLILGDQNKNDIQPPLSQFHNAYPIKLDMTNVVLTINKLLATPLPVQLLETIFDKYWEDFEKPYKKIIEDVEPETVPEERKDDDILNEILTSVRGFDKRIRNLENLNVNYLNDRKVKTYRGASNYDLNHFEFIKENEAAVEKTLEFLRERFGNTELSSILNEDLELALAEALDALGIKNTKHREGIVKLVLSQIPIF